MISFTVANFTSFLVYICIFSRSYFDGSFYFVPILIPHMIYLAITWISKHCNRDDRNWRVFSCLFMLIIVPVITWLFFPKWVVFTAVGFWLLQLRMTLFLNVERFIWDCYGNNLPRFRIEALDTLRDDPVYDVWGRFEDKEDKWNIWMLFMVFMAILLCLGCIFEGCAGLWNML